MEHQVVGVEDHRGADVASQHEAGVLGESGGYEAELAALRPEALEVRDDGRMLEEALNLVDEEPGGPFLGEVLVHAVAHLLQRGQHAEDLHVGVQVVEVDVHHRGVEGHVGPSVEEREGALDVPLVSQGDVSGSRLRLLQEEVVEVLEHRGALVAGPAVGLFHAPCDDGSLRLGEALVSLRHHRCGERQEGVHLEGLLERLVKGFHVLRVEGVHELARVGCEPDAHAASRLCDRASLTGRVDPDSLSLVAVEHADLQPDALLGVRLARARRSEVESHGRGQG